MQVKKKVLVTQSSPTLCNPMDCNLCPKNSPGKNTGMGNHSLLQVISMTRGLNPGRLHRRQILHRMSHQGSPKEHMVRGNNHTETNRFLPKIHFHIYNVLGVESMHLHISVSLQHNSESIFLCRLAKCMCNVMKFLKIRHQG